VEAFSICKLVPFTEQYRILKEWPNAAAISFSPAKYQKMVHYLRVTPDNEAESFPPDCLEVLYSMIKEISDTTSYTDLIFMSNDHADLHNQQKLEQLAKATSQRVISKHSEIIVCI
jgi:hypothetical protein